MSTAPPATAELSSLTADDVALFAARLAVTPVADDAAEAIDRIRRFTQLHGAIAAAQMREGVALADERVAQDATRGVREHRRGRGAAAELGLALRVSPNQAARWLAGARTLRRDLPGVFAALGRGETSQRRALLVAQEVAFLSPEHRRAVDAEVAPRLEGSGDRRVEGEARRAAQRLDPEGAVAKARNATSARRVTVRPAPDTMSWFTVLTSVEQGVAAYASLRRHADGLIAVGKQGTNPDGSLRTRDQVMADTAVERITGLARAEDVPIEIMLVMSEQTLLRDGDEPGFVPGVGPVSAPHARELALRHRIDRADRVGAQARAEAKRWIRRLYLAPDRRRLAGMDSSRREFGENQRLFIRIRDEDTCRTPYCDAPVRHVDHVAPHVAGGPTSVDNGQGYCAACNYTKQAAGWRTRRERDGSVITVTPTGHRYRSPEPRPPGADRRRAPVVEVDVGWHRAA